MTAIINDVCKVYSGNNSNLKPENIIHCGLYRRLLVLLL
jgi:hypothetical protein